MYSYYQKIKAKITALQKQIDSLENNGKFKTIPDLLILKDKYSELKQEFYNEDIEDKILIEKYNSLEQLEKQII